MNTKCTSDFDIYIVLNKVAMPDGDNFWSITSVVPCTHTDPMMAQRFVDNSYVQLFGGTVKNTDQEITPLEYSLFLYDLSVKLNNLHKVSLSMKKFLVKAGKLIFLSFQNFYVQRVAGVQE